jgi:hypothetical protein
MYAVYPRISVRCTQESVQRDSTGVVVHALVMVRVGTESAMFAEDCVCAIRRRMDGLLLKAGLRVEAISKEGTPHHFAKGADTDQGTDTDDKGNGLDRL